MPSEEWRELSNSRPTNSGKKKQGGYLVEDELIKGVLEKGDSYELQYSSPEEVDKMRVRLNARGKGRIRVLTSSDPDKKNSIFIGPAEEK